MLVLKNLLFISLIKYSKNHVWLFLLVQETLCLCAHWKCANEIFIFCSLTSLCSVDPSYSTELKSKHFRDFEQFSCCSYNRKNAEQHWWVIHWTFQIPYGWWRWPSKDSWCWCLLVLNPLWESLQQQGFPPLSEWCSRRLEALRHWKTCALPG